MFRHFVHQPLHHLPAEVPVGHFPPSKHDRGLHLVAFFEELQNSIALRLVIMFACARPKFHFLELDGLLVLSRLMLPLVELVEVLAVIDDAADRRRGGGRNFYEVQSLAPRDLQGFKGGHDAKLIAVLVNHPDFFSPDPLINPNVPICDKNSLPAPLRLWTSLTGPASTPSPNRGAEG